MKHPLDQFLHASLSNAVENDVPSFESFQEKSVIPKEDQLDHWLENHTNSVPLENPNFAEFLKYQEKQESATHPLDEWLHTQSSQHSKAGRLSFQEFKSYWNGLILKKWSKRAAILLLIFFSGWSIQKFGINEEGNLGIESESKGNLHQAQPNLAEQPKSGTISGLAGSSRARKLAHRNPILQNNSKAEKINLTQTKSINSRSFEPTLFNSKETIRTKRKLKKSLESIESKLTSNFNNRGAFLENSETSNSKGKMVVENLEFSPLKSKTRLIQGNFQRKDDLPIVKSNNKKRNFLQLSLSSGSTNQKLEYFGEKNKHWDPLQSWKIIPQMNIGILWIKPMNKGFGVGFGGGVSMSTFKKEIEYHITEIPVLDSLTGRILGYIPLGPRGQIHKEEQIEVTQSRMNLQGSIYKSWKINPSLELGIQQNVGMGFQKMNIHQIVDPISLESTNMPSKIEWEAVGKSSIWIQSRVAEHWGIGAQIGRPFSVKFSNKNSLIFREMSIFEAGVSVRYYLKSK
jgi:hypothetical protein